MPLEEEDTKGSLLMGFAEVSKRLLVDIYMSERSVGGQICSQRCS